MDFSTALHSRADDSSGRPNSYKAIGVSLAVASGLFIGVSFVIKKVGLLKANVKYNEEAGEGYGYLKNLWWWTGMTLMIVGEICNFVAYAFVDAILVTPLGALAVVVTTILSAIFLKERLSFVGKVGCFTCILGSVVIAMNAPEQSSVSNIQEMKECVIAPGFLSYAGVIIVGSIATAVWAGPRYGKKSMFVYISICSMIGGLSVVATQGLGSAILAQIHGESQFKEWFLYVLFVFVVATLLTEIIYLNKALNLFNAALVTPTYYVLFTSATIITSAILFKGFKGTGTQIATVVMGFLQICAGVILLQLSKSAKDVPDAAIFKGDLDQIREVATQEEPESEPKADSIRGTAAIIRRLSTPRRTMEAEEARRYYRERQEEQQQQQAGAADGDVYEWDGLRRRKTVTGEGPNMNRARTPSIKKHPMPPWGMSRFPDLDEEERPTTQQSGQHSFLGDMRTRASSRGAASWQPIQEEEPGMQSVSLAPMGGHNVDTSYHGATLSTGDEGGPGRERSRSAVSWATDDVENPAKRQFSFNIFNRGHSHSHPEPPTSPKIPRGILRRNHQYEQTRSEEESLGLVHGDPRVDADEKLERTASTSSSSDEDLPTPPGDTGSRSPPGYYQAIETHPAPPSVPSRAVRRNPLPPLPDEAPLEDPYVDIDVHRPSERRDSAQSAGPHSPGPSERNQGWRRVGNGGSFL